MLSTLLCNSNNPLHAILARANDKEAGHKNKVSTEASIFYVCKIVIVFYVITCEDPPSVKNAIEFTVYTGSFLIES